MGATDELDAYERRWDAFRRWRWTSRGNPKELLTADPGSFKARRGDVVLKLDDVPEQLRRSVYGRLEQTIEALVLEEHARMKLALMQAAIAGAKGALSRLEPLAAELEKTIAGPLPTSTPGPNAAAELKRLADALGAIGDEEPVAAPAESK